VPTIQPGQHFESPRLQGVAGQDGNGFAKGLVAGGLATAQIVVVKSRQVVVDQRVSVEHLDGRAQTLDARRKMAGNGDSGFVGEQRAQPLSAGEDGVAHGAVNRRRNCFDRRDQLIEGTVGPLRGLIAQ